MIATIRRAIIYLATRLEEGVHINRVLITLVQ